MATSIPRFVAPLLAVLAAGVALAAAPRGSQAEPVAGAGRTSYALPPGVLRLSRARLEAGMGESVTFTVKLTRRAVSDGTLELTLPRVWLQRSGVSGLPYAKVPMRGRASSARASVRRDGRVVRFAFDHARHDDSASYTVTDRGLVPRVYELPFRWRENGRVTRRGTANVAVVVVPRPPVR